MKPMTSGSYITLINRFWRMHRTCQFSPQTIAVYFYLLDVANTARWPDRFIHSDSIIASVVGISLPTLRKIRTILKDAGLVSFESGGRGHAHKTVYSLTGCVDCQKANSSECMVRCDRDAAPSDASQSSRQPEHPAASAVEPPSAPPIRHEAPTADHKQRNTDGLRQRLKELGASPVDAARILSLSDFGAIGHPVWSALADLRRSQPGAIKSPVKFILSRLQA